MWGFPCNHCFFFFFFSPPVSILVANKSECHRIYRASFVLFKKKKKILFTIILIKIFSTSKYLQRCFFFFLKEWWGSYSFCVCVRGGGGWDLHTTHYIPSVPLLFSAWVGCFKQCLAKTPPSLLLSD